MKRHAFVLGIILIMGYTTLTQAQSLTAPGAQVQKLHSNFSFTEGPATDSAGNVFFTDIPNNRILVSLTSGYLTSFTEDSQGANGLYFDARGNLLACQGGGRKLVSYSSQGVETVLVDTYQGKRFNSLNDLWIDSRGGIYFTDPRYGNREGMKQDGEHVYYLAGPKEKPERVINDMVRPNGLIGTPNGKTLYVTDHGGKKTFSYAISSNGSLTQKTLFAPEGSDGMTMDEKGNVYLTTNAIAIYSPLGKKIQEIPITERPANVTFGGKDKKTLYITARTSLYAIEMSVKGN